MPPAASTRSDVPRQAVFMACDGRAEVVCMSDAITETATERVRQAIAAGRAPGRKDVEHALREVFGLSARVAKRFAAEGSKALSAVDEVTDTDDLRAQVSRLTELVNSLRN